MDRRSSPTFQTVVLGPIFLNAQSRPSFDHRQIVAGPTSRSAATIGNRTWAASGKASKFAKACRTASDFPGHASLGAALARRRVPAEVDGAEVSAAIDGAETAEGIDGAAAIVRFRVRLVMVSLS